MAQTDPELQGLNDTEQQYASREETWWDSSSDNVAEARCLVSGQQLIASKEVWPKRILWDTLSHTTASSVRFICLLLGDVARVEEGRYAGRRWVRLKYMIWHSQRTNKILQKKNRFFFHTIRPNHSFPSLTPPRILYPPSPPHLLLLHFLFRKEHTSKTINSQTGPNKIKRNKARKSNPVGKECQEMANNSEIHIVPLLWVPEKPSSCRWPSAYSWRSYAGGRLVAPSVSVSPFVSCVDDSMGQVFLLSSISMTPTLCLHPLWSLRGGTR